MTSERFNIRDMSLALILSQAAIEIDTYLLGQKTDFTGLNQLERE